MRTITYPPVILMTLVVFSVSGCMRSEFCEDLEGRPGWSKTTAISLSVGEIVSDTLTREDCDASSDFRFFGDAKPEVRGDFRYYEFQADSAVGYKALVKSGKSEGGLYYASVAVTDDSSADVQMLGYTDFPAMTNVVGFLGGGVRHMEVTSAASSLAFDIAVHRGLFPGTDGDQVPALLDPYTYGADSVVAADGMTIDILLTVDSDVALLSALVGFKDADDRFSIQGSIENIAVEAGTDTATLTVPFFNGAATPKGTEYYAQVIACDESVTSCGFTTGTLYAEKSGNFSILIPGLSAIYSTLPMPFFSVE